MRRHGLHPGEVGARGDGGDADGGVRGVEEGALGRGGAVVGEGAEDVGAGEDGGGGEGEEGDGEEAFGDHFDEVASRDELIMWREV